MEELFDIKIIIGEQTPETKYIENTKEFINKNNKLLMSFLAFAITKQTAVGLAANQVSANGERCLNRFFAFKDKDLMWKLVFNPTILEYIGMRETKLEGCLTWPGRTIVAERNRAIKVNYTDEKGEQKIEIKTGFEAQIWQHEINHLNGVEERLEDDRFEIKEKIKEPERNEQCPCGSGKKYKNCCLKYE